VQDVQAACAAAAALEPPALRLLLSADAEVSLPQALRLEAQAQAVVLLVGPEGGLAEPELAAAQTHGFICCRLGPRILRAETAPVAALAAIAALAGDLR
jgi:16S rRNA (uracil1498-N3)-methyltransferase